MAGASLKGLEEPLFSKLIFKISRSFPFLHRFLEDFSFDLFDLTREFKYPVLRIEGIPVLLWLVAILLSQLLNEFCL
jgi:hypothetical protein